FACRRHLDTLSTVPAERVTYELRLILEARHTRRAAEDLHSIGIDAFAFGFELETRDIDGWERLETPLGEAGGRAVDVIALLLMDRSGTRAPLLERWTWRRDEVRDVTAILRVIDATAANEQELLLTAAEEGVVPSERAAAILLARVERRKASLIDTILRREPSPFNVQPLLDGKDIATLTGAAGPAVGRLKRTLWEKQVSGEVRTEEDARRLVESLSR
ncbi:MAG TPA: hypothetical protein VM534_00480, partial [Thermoanaerobaculia bacterium]|nr:hypothetical protein [Thermoanaerobaculia bacterium]